MIATCTIFVKSPGPIFQSSSKWLLLKIKAYNCVHLKLRQHTQTYMPIQMDLSKPE